MTRKFVENWLDNVDPTLEITKPSAREGSSSVLPLFCPSQMSATDLAPE